MIFDTDVLIWVLRGNAKAAKAVDTAGERSLSTVTYMELLQGARDNAEVRGIKAFLSDMQFAMLPLTENIGHRATIYMEEYGLAIAMGVADARFIARVSAGRLQLTQRFNRSHRCNHLLRR